eukprot:COSAG01_NODE_119_length_25410_cov_1333.312275_9_plen_80_part_00
MPPREVSWLCVPRTHHITQPPRRAGGPWPGPRGNSMPLLGPARAVVGVVARDRMPGGAAGRQRQAACACCLVCFLLGLW